MTYRASNATYRRNLYADARQYGARAVRLFFLLQSGCCEEPLRALVWALLRADLGRAMSAARRYQEKGGKVPATARKSREEREQQAELKNLGLQGPFTGPAHATHKPLV